MVSRIPFPGPLRRVRKGKVNDACKLYRYDLRWSNAEARNRMPAIINKIVRDVSTPVFFSLKFGQGQDNWGISLIYARLRHNVFSIRVNATHFVTNGRIDHLFHQVTTRRANHFVLNKGYLRHLVATILLLLFLSLTAKLLHFTRLTVKFLSIWQLTVNPSATLMESWFLKPSI